MFLKDLFVACYQHLATPHVLARFSLVGLFSVPASEKTPARKNAPTNCRLFCCAFEDATVRGFVAICYDVLVMPCIREGSSKRISCDVLQTAAFSRGCVKRTHQWVRMLSCSNVGNKNYCLFKITIVYLLN